MGRGVIPSRHVAAQVHVQQVQVPVQQVQGIVGAFAVVAASLVAQVCTPLRNMTSCECFFFFKIK